MKEKRRGCRSRNRPDKVESRAGGRRCRRRLLWSAKVSELDEGAITQVDMETHTAPARGGAAKVHAARHFTDIIVIAVRREGNAIAILAAHGRGITVGRTSLEAEVGSVSANTLGAAAAIESQSNHEVKKCQRAFNSPIIGARAVLAVCRTTTALQQRAARVARVVRGDSNSRFISVRNIRVVLVQTLHSAWG